MNIIKMLVKIAFALNLEWKIKSVGKLISTKSLNELLSPLKVLMLHLKLITPGDSLSNLQWQVFILRNAQSSVLQADSLYT